MTAPVLDQTTPLCFSIIGTRGIRATLVDRCGKPVYGPNSQAVSAGIVSIELEPEVEEGDDYSQKNAAGDECFPSFKGPDVIKWWNVTLEFCNVDPALFTLMMRTWRPVLDYSRTLTTGWRMGSQVSSVDGFALETWPKAAGAGVGQLCDAAGNELPDDPEGYDPGAYFLLPWLIPTAPDSWTLENEPTTFTLKCRSKSGSLWKKGPYNVVLNGPGQPGPLIDPIDPGFRLREEDDPNGITGGDPTHFHGELTVVAPPTFRRCGTFPLWDQSATKAELSTDGSAGRTVQLTVTNWAEIGGSGTVEWGDGTKEPVPADSEGRISHEYAADLDGKEQKITFYPANSAEPTEITFTPSAPVTTDSLEISGDASVAVGSTLAVTATATRSDGSTPDVTSDASWSSSDTSIATVDGGTVTGVAAGTVTITAEYDGQSATHDVEVTGSSTQQSRTARVGKTSKYGG